jgi:hypothetical protein
LRSSNVIESSTRSKRYKIRGVAHNRAHEVVLWKVETGVENCPGMYLQFSGVAGFRTPRLRRTLSSLARPYQTLSSLAALYQAFPIPPGFTWLRLASVSPRYRRGSSQASNPVYFKVNYHGDPVYLLSMIPSSVWWMSFSGDGCHGTPLRRCKKAWTCGEHQRCRLSLVWESSPQATAAAGHWCPR